MKIGDLEVADSLFATRKDYSSLIKSLMYHQKYLILDLGDELVSLEISKVTDNAVYLKIRTDGTVGKV